MKKLFVLLSGSALMLMMMGAVADSDRNFQEETLKSAGSFRVVCSEPLMNMTDAWIKAFSKENSQANIQLVTMEELTASGQKPEPGDFILMSESDLASSKLPLVSSSVIARDPVVPVVHASHSALALFAQVGMAESAFRTVLTSDKSITWRDLTGEGTEKPVRVYVSGDASVVNSLTAWVGGEMSASGVTILSEGESVVDRLTRDPEAIGFCHLSEINALGEKESGSSLAFLPIDKNGSGQLESWEQVYRDGASVLRAAWLGKYPRALSGNVMIASLTEVSDQEAGSFLGFIYGEGQQTVAKAGLFSLPGSERYAAMSRMLPKNVDVESKGLLSKGSTTVLLVVGGMLVLVIIALVTWGMIRRSRRTRLLKSHDNRVINSQTMEAPGGLFFDKTHTWAIMESDGKVRIGIDDFLQHVTGPITRIKMKNQGDFVRKGEPFLTIVQMGKQLEVSAPVTGTIRSYNQILYNDPSLLNSSPFQKGWIYMIEPTNWLREMNLMQMSDHYKLWLKNEVERLKQFLTAELNSNRQKVSHLVLQDGGEISNAALAQLGPEVWEEFQEEFINKSNQ